MRRGKEERGWLGGKGKLILREENEKRKKKSREKKREEKGHLPSKRPPARSEQPLLFMVHHAAKQIHRKRENVTEREGENQKIRNCR